MKYKIPIAIIAIILMSSTCSASVFSAYANTATTTQTHAISDSHDDFKALIHSLNTQTAMGNMDAEMEDYNIEVLKVTIPEISEQFFIGKGKGIIDYYGKSDAEVTLSFSQLQKIIPFLTDGKLSFLERFQIYAIYKVGAL